MHCDDCKQQISQFLDNDLDEGAASMVRGHLADCGGCAQVCEDLSSILFAASVEPAGDLVPPNSKALWCRINNIIESEAKPAPAAEPAPPRKRFWQLSLPQLAVAVLSIAAVSSLLTVIGISRYTQPPPAEDFTSRSEATQTTFEKLMSKVGLIETPQQANERHLKQQMAAIAYWDNRVQARRMQWDSRTREAFDRNLQAIDVSVDQYTKILAKDPDDELTVEMLDSVMNDKMNLLRDFSDL